jgi:SpoVK/Ycf46/Vps4 family AAA+-type ATPase
MQNIDAMGRDHILVAATNHHHLLDPAIWRRFAYKVEMQLPDMDTRLSLLRHFLGRFADDATVEIGAAMSDGMTGAQLRDISENAIRDCILADQEAIAQRAFLSHFVGDGTLAVQVQAVRAIDKKRFTQKRLAEMFGIAQSYVCDLLKQKADHAQDLCPDEGCFGEERHRLPNRSQ